MKIELTNAQLRLLQSLRDKKKVPRPPFCKVGNKLRSMGLVNFSFVAGWWITAKGLEVLNAGDR